MQNLHRCARDNDYPLATEWQSSSFPWKTRLRPSDNRARPWRRQCDPPWGRLCAHGRDVPAHHPSGPDSSWRCPDCSGLLRILAPAAQVARAAERRFADEFAHDQPILCLALRPRVPGPLWRVGISAAETASAPLRRLSAAARWPGRSIPVEGWRAGHALSPSLLCAYAETAGLKQHGCYFLPCLLSAP